VAQNDALLTVRALRKYFPVRGGILHTVQAQVLTLLQTLKHDLGLT
jgi:hypothetical protein